MIDEGKGKHVDNLRIIQLCEADLNFILHTIWGHRLIRHSCQHFALDSSQYALPCQTCNNTVLNKLLFLDLSQQTLTPGILFDYDAKAAFDRVIAGLFMFYLLQHMSFHLITGFGCSAQEFCNTEADITGQRFFREAALLPPSISSILMCPWLPIIR